MYSIKKNLSYTRPCFAVHVKKDYFTENWYFIHVKTHKKISVFYSGRTIKVGVPPPNTLGVFFFFSFIFSF